MTSVLFTAHLAAVVLAALAVWTFRHEPTGRAASRLDWVWPPLFTVLAAAILLVVSPGKRVELWAAAIVGGLVVGALAGAMLLKVNQDHGRLLIRVAPVWDGIGAASLLFVLAVVRFVSSDIAGRKSSGFGVLAASATFLAAYVAARFIVGRFYTAPRSIHIDMMRGGNPRRTLVH